MARKSSVTRSAKSGRFIKVVKKAARTSAKVAASKKGKPGNPGHTTKN